MADVFISYARADRGRVRLIAQALMAEGFSVWWDPEIKPGKKWDDLIRRELESADAVVTCWTKTSSKSKWVLAETSFADGRKKLAPALVQACDPPIPYNMVQSADLTRWRGNADDLEWVALLGAVKALVDARRKIAAVAPPPPGEAEAAQAGATGTSASPAAGPEVVGYEAERYVPSQVRGRANGFPFGRMAAGIGLTAALTFGVLASPDLTRQAQDLIAQMQPAASAPLPEPPLPPPPEASPFDAPAPAAPLETAAVDTHTIEPPTSATPPAVQPTVSPPTTPPSPVRSPRPEPGALTPVAVTPLTPAPDPRQPWTDLDMCAQTLAARCPATTARRPGFVQDGVLTAQEGAFLRAVGVETRVIDASVAQRCLALLPTATATVDAAGAVTPLGTACGLKPTDKTLSPAAKAALAAGASILLERALTSGSTPPQTPQTPATQRPPPTTAPR